MKATYSAVLVTEMFLSLHERLTSAYTYMHHLAQLYKTQSTAQRRFKIVFVSLDFLMLYLNCFLEGAVSCKEFQPLQMSATKISINLKVDVV